MNRGDIIEWVDMPYIRIHPHFKSIKRCWREHVENLREHCGVRVLVQVFDEVMKRQYI